MKNWKYVIVLLLAGVVLLIAISFMRRSRSGEWFDKMSRVMDESFKSNGLVKVGDNTWRLPRDGETNTPMVDKTNTVNQ